ncbi:MAG: hypothetical protein ACXU8N_05625 [Telluria sp.]
MHDISTLRRVLLAAVLSVCGSLDATAADVKAQQLQDLEAARIDYVLASKAFSDDNRSRALAAIDAARARAGAMSQAEFTLTLARLAALADNAHDELVPNRKVPGPRLPVRLVSFGSDLVVALSAPNLPELAGAHVLELGGKKAEELPAIAHGLIGGPERYATSNASWLWESPDLLSALGFKVDHGRVHATLRLRGGEVVERMLEPLDSKQVPPASPAELLRNARSAPESGPAWHSALLGAPVPLAMREPEKRFRAVPIPNFDTLYVQFRANYDRDGGRELGKFAGDTAALAMQMHPRFIVIDERYNGGGNTDLTRELMKVLAAAARDKVYIFTSEYTFSAGIVSSAIAAQAAGPKARLVGAPVGDRLRWWSENPMRCLPNSGHCFTPSYGLWDLQKGCAKEAGCFGDAYEVKVKGLDPDLAAPLTAADWLAGYDPALAAAAADAAQGGTR